MKKLMTVLAAALDIGERYENRQPPTYSAENPENPPPCHDT